MCIGTYTFHRTIDDRYASRHHTASGTLTISQTAWQESGVWHSLNDSPFYQRYLLHFENGGVCVSYTDGAVFYTLPHIHGTHSITHQCKGDLYQGTWTYNTDTLHLTWQVTGAHKNYTMISIYNKL